MGQPLSEPAAPAVRLAVRLASSGAPCPRSAPSYPSEASACTGARRKKHSLRVTRSCGTADASLGAGTWHRSMIPDLRRWGGGRPRTGRLLRGTPRLPGHDARQHAALLVTQLIHTVRRNYAGGQAENVVQTMHCSPPGRGRVRECLTDSERAVQPDRSSCMS